MNFTFPYLECGVCGRDDDNECEECLPNDEALTMTQPEQRKFIGSGEDANMFMEMK